MSFGLHHEDHRGGVPVCDRSLTATICAFAAGLRFEDIPHQVVRKASLHLLDTLGCIAGGVDLDLSKAAREFARAAGMQGEALVFGAADGAAAHTAALVNATFANMLDFDDGFEVGGKGMGHPGSTIISAALAALRPGTLLDGRRFLTAIVAGMEVNNRLILAMQPTPQRFAEVYGISQHQTIGAAVTYGILIGLDARSLENAVGLAGGLTPVPSLHKYNWTARPIISFKDFVAPAAQMGVQAVMLHEAGFIGSRDILDGEAGFFRMAGSDRFRPDILVGGLQQDWQMLRGSFKVYPACRWIASAIEAFKLAFEESGLSMQDIEDIHVESFADVAEKLMSRVPVNAVDAQFCLPYLLGVVASGEPAGKAWFSPAALGRKDILEVAHLVRASVNADMDALMRGEERRPAAMVTVSGKGRSTMRYIDAPLGGELRPVSEAMVVQKAIENFGFSPSQSHDLADRYLSLGRCPDVHLLMVEFNSLMSNARS